MFPFAVVDTRYALPRFDWFYTERKTYPIGFLANFSEGFLVVIEFVSINAVSVYDEMRMDVLLVNMCRDNDLTILAKNF